LFAQVESRLREDILNNRLPPGAKLPSEAELEVAFGVSRITVRQALAQLHKQGLINKINGKGSFVTRPSDAPRLGPLTGFYEHMRTRGNSPSGRTLSVREVRASKEAAEALQIEPGSLLTQIKILRSVNGQPMAYGVLHALPPIAHALIQENLDDHDVVSILEVSLGYRLASIQIEAGAVAAGKLRGRLLEVDPATPLVHIRFTPHDVMGQPLTYSDMYFRSDRFTYKAVVKR